MTLAVVTWRERLNLTSTIKDGYRVGDATVEFSDIAGLDGDAPREERRKRLRELIEDGEQVAAALNRQKAIASTTTVTAPGNHQE
jgi:hypothetical protein